MKFSVNKTLLAQLATIVQRASSTKDAMPILSGLSIVASSNSISLTATDLEIGIKKKLTEVNVIEEGQVLINARYFTDLVRYLPETEITLELDVEKSRLKVIYGKSSSSLNIYDDQDFPDLPLTKLQEICRVPQNLFKDCIRKTVFAAAQTHFKPVFTGILFDFQPDGLQIVASDTHRLALIKYENIKTAEKVGQIVVPSRNLSELSRILEDTDKEISIGLAENNIVFYDEEEGWYFLSRLIEGQYPNYQQVIPKEFINTYSIDSSLMVNSLERASLMPTDGKAIKHVVMEFTGDEPIVSAFSEKMGELKEFIEEIEVESDENVTVAFNTRYLLDIVKIVQNENAKIELKVTGSMSPAVIKNPEDQTYIYVLVPLRTG